MEQIAINILPKGAKPVCHSSQFDEGRQIMFNLFNDATPYTLSGTETISVLVRKPDGAEVVDSVTNTSDNYVIWDVSADACELSGVCECELSIVENGIVLGSKNFTMKVEEDAYGGKNIEVRTASGSIATFNTNMVEAFKSLKSDITPVQDLHGYSKPWSGGGGKNKVNVNNQAGTSNEHIRQYVLNLPAGTYTVSAFCSSTANTDCAVLFIYSDDTNSPIQYLRNGNWSGVTINATKQVKQLNLYSSTGYSTSQNYTLTAINSLQVESGSQATSYEPYSNICPISGFSALNVTRTGKNRLNYDAWKTITSVRCTCVWENNGIKMTATGNDAYTDFSNGYFPVDARIPVSEGETITLSWEETTNKTGIVVIFPNGTTTGMVSANNERTKKLSYTATSGVEYVSFRFGVANIGDTIAYKNIQIENGNQASDYTPYNGQTKTVNFGQTVYGGVADVKNGKVTLTHGIVDLGSLTWSKQTSVGGTKTYFRTASELADCKKNTNVGQLQGLICSNYAEDTWSHTVDTVGYDSTICTGWTNKSYIAINDQSKASMSADDFKTAMSSVMLCYPLATPIEISMTPENLTALSGQNNVYGDTNGDTTVEYYIEV